MSRYILRFDDVTPAMNWPNFLQVKTVAENLGIKSILGVIPDCKDLKLSVQEPVSDFFSRVKSYAEFGDSIAQHGYTHVYDSKDGGILGINKNSEFAGHSYEVQYQRLLAGKSILESHNVWQPYFMAPSHSFDVNTLLALKSLKFKALTDGYGYCQHFNTDMVLVPQLTSKPVDLGFGLHTFCVHVNHLKPKAIYNLIRIIKENYKKFVDFQEVVNEPVIDYLQHKLLRRITEFSLRGIRAVRR